MAGFKGLFVRSGTVGTQPVEGRKSLAGLLVPSSVLGARQGILPAPGDPLRVTGTAGWEYSVNAGHVATSRSDADGSTLFGNDGTTLTPAVSAAPGSGSRYDLIYMRHLDPDQGEGDPTVVVGVVEGTASGTPVKPAVPAGAVVVAEALMAAGATSTNHANVTITQVLGKTVARGGIIPVANATERDALPMWEGLYADQADTDQLYRCDGTAWEVRGPVQPTRGSFSGDISGAAPVIVPHSLGVIPSQVLISKKVSTFSHLFNIQRDTTDSANFVVSAYRYDGAALTDTPVAFDWIAYP